MGKHSEEKEVFQVFNKKLMIIFALIILVAVISAFKINDIIAYFTSTSSVTNELSVEAEYTVTFDANGGTGTMADQVISYNLPTALSANTFAKTGYVFKEWNTESDGTGTVYTAGQEVNNLGDETLYAIWTLVTVTLDSNGGIIPETEGWTGSGASATKEYMVGDEYGEFPEPTRTGYTFQGWNGKNKFENPADGQRTIHNTRITLDNLKYTLNGQVSNTSVNSIGIGLYGLNIANYPGLLFRYGATKKTIPAGTYTFSIDKISGNTPPQWCAVELRRYSNGGTLASINLSANQTSKAFTINADTDVYYDIGSNTNGQVFENLSFYVQLEEGDTATPYEPYFVTSTVPVTTANNHTLTAIWEPNELEFEDQDIKKEYSSSAQTASITEASNGTGTYTYTVKSETNEEGTDTNYISISGTTINIAAETPCGLYTVVVTAIDSDSGVTKDATYTIQIGSAYTVNHYGHNLGTNINTYTLMQTETKYGETGENIAITEANLGKTIAGFTYEEGFLTGDTTKPETPPDTDTTILADDSTEINLYYRRNYLYIQYDLNGGAFSRRNTFYSIEGSLLTGDGNTKFITGCYGSKVGSFDSSSRK